MHTSAVDPTVHQKWARLDGRDDKVNLASTPELTLPERGVQLTEFSTSAPVHVDVGSTRMEAALLVPQDVVSFAVVAGAVGTNQQERFFREREIGHLPVVATVGSTDFLRFDDGIFPFLRHPPGPRSTRRGVLRGRVP